MTIADTARAVMRVMGVKEDMLTFVRDRKGQDRRYAIDFTKIRDELGWAPSVTFEQGLAEMVDWYRKNESWWRPIKNSSGYQQWYSGQMRNGNQALGSQEVGR